MGVTDVGRRIEHLTSLIASEALFASELADTYYKRALAFLEREAMGDDDRMLDDFRSALSFPELPLELRSIAHYNCAVHLAGRKGPGDIEESLARLAMVADLSNSKESVWTLALLRRAAICEMRAEPGDIELAVADYGRILASPFVSEENQAEALHNRARFCWIRGFCDLALQDCANVIEIRMAPKHLMASTKLIQGSIYRKTRNSVGAVEVLTSALEIDEASPTVKACALYERGLVYEERAEVSDRERAIADYRGALAIPGLSFSFREIVCEALHRTGWR